MSEKDLPCIKYHLTAARKKKLQIEAVNQSLTMSKLLDQKLFGKNENKN